MVRFAFTLFLRDFDNPVEAYKAFSIEQTTRRKGYRRMKVLVTGGAGYIGSILNEHLLDAGHDVTVVDSLMYGEANLFHLCENPNFDFHKGDVRDEAFIKEHLKGVDAVIPLAAIGHD